MATQVIKWKDKFGNEYDTEQEAIRVEQHADICDLLNLGYEHSFPSNPEMLEQIVKFFQSELDAARERVRKYGGK